MKNLFLIIILFTSITSSQDLKKVATGINFPEGPAWDGSRSLYVSGIEGGNIIKITDDESSVFIDSGTTIMKQTNGLTFGKDGWLYGCDLGAGAIIRISMEKKVEIVSAGYQGSGFDTPNDLAFHANGSLYFSEPNSDKPDGRLFRLNVESGELHTDAR
jgi:gluconolactonase